MPALDDVLPLLRCPLCGAALARADDGIHCGEGHAFDVARQGYLSLLTGPGPAGDTADMVAARERLLGAGHFDPLADAVADAIAPADAGYIVDLGAGTGWYLARLLEREPGATGLALDVSKPALRRAARAHARLAAVACDAWGPLPLHDGAAAAVLNVFAPRNGPEIGRVLAPGGLAVFVTPAEHHLAELGAPLAVDERKQERLREQVEPALRIQDRREVEWTLSLDQAAARDAIAMGPSAFHLSSAELDELVAGLPQPLAATAAVVITTATTG